MNKAETRTSSGRTSVSEQKTLGWNMGEAQVEIRPCTETKLQASSLSHCDVVMVIEKGKRIFLSCTSRSNTNCSKKGERAAEPAFKIHNSNFQVVCCNTLVYCKWPVGELQEFGGVLVGPLGMWSPPLPPAP